MVLKKNNSNNGDLQPYNPKNGEYKEKDYSCDIYNYYARKLGGVKEDFPLNFPSIKHHPSEYISDYFNSLIDWNEVEIDKRKMLFLIDEKSIKKRYLIFKKELGYTDDNIDDLEKQFRDGASRYEVFLTKKNDDYGFRVKIFMPIYSFDRSKYLIIKTIWVVKEGKNPKLATAYFYPNYKGDAKDEI